MTERIVGPGINVEVEGMTVAFVDRVAEGRRRGGAVTGEPAPTDGLLAKALAAAGFDIAATLAFSGGDDRGRRSAESPAARLALDVGVDEDAVVLIETEGGILRWARPVSREASAGTRRHAAGAVTLRFDLLTGAAPEEGVGRRTSLAEPALDRILKPVRTYVLRFLVRRSLPAAVAWLEGDAVGGPVCLGGALQSGPSVPRDIREWTPRPLLQSGDQAPRRVLLLVHGTFSSTAGSFGQLLATEEGIAFLDGAARDYDLVLGFDHRTLAMTPAENARELLGCLSGLRLAPECELDAIAFSRGGLVYRIFAEQLLPASDLRVRLGKAIFVGCTNGGTSLASPANWAAMIDIYTNVAVAAVRGLGLLAGGGAAGIVAAETIKTVGRFVQLLSEVAITEHYVPGLAAMEPESGTIASLNGAGGRSERPARYHVVSSSFEPSRGGARGLTVDLGRYLADRISDRLFGSDNDLVVHTASMSDFGTRSWVAEADTYAFGDSADLYHTVYFADPQVAGCLTSWLLDPSPPRIRRMGAAAPVDANFGFAPPFREAVPLSRASLPRLERTGSPEARGGEAAAAPEASGTVERHVSAEMQQYPRLGAVANLFVTISASALPGADGGARGSTDGAVTIARDSNVDIHVVPLSNCRVVGDACRSVEPAATEELVARFMVEGVDAGPAAILVEARQDGATLASLTLRPEFLQGEQEIIRAAQPAAAAPPDEQPILVLRIYEYREQGRLRTLRFDLQGRKPDLALLIDQNVDQPVDLNAYLSEVLAEAERAWNLSDGDDAGIVYRSFLSRFAADAKARSEALLPREVRQLLWDNRKTIGAVQVISENPVIPWELMYVSDPAGQSDEEGGFLAEWGVVRWLHGARAPGPELSLSGNRARFVIPVYRDGSAPLAGAQEEREMLEGEFAGIAPVEANSLDVIDFLRNAKDCDLLHFACHGRTTSGSVLRSELAMQGISRSGKAQPDGLSTDQVRQSVRFGAGPQRALVVLNACQAGRGGYGVTGAAGFADAFIRPVSGQGAAAFVGALWSIDDRLALTFARTFYEALRNGAMLVEAVKAARRACQDRSDLTWLAYTVYGNPFARVRP